MNLNQGPVFVGGLSRSGKTLLCSALALHPNLAIPIRETNWWTYFYQRYGNLEHPDNLERCLAAMLRYSRKGKSFLDLDPNRIREDFWQGKPTYARLFALPHAHYADRLGKPRWGVQAVSEDRFTHLIMEAYPAAKMIYVIRDPRDRYIATAYRHPPRWREVVLATATWLNSITLAKSYQKLYPERFMVVCYELLVSQPEEVMRDVLAFLDEAPGPVVSELQNKFQYKDENISTAFIGRFQEMMSQYEIVFMQSLLKQDMIVFNYELVPVRLALRESLKFYLMEKPINWTYLLVWRVWDILRIKIPIWMGPSPLI